MTRPSANEIRQQFIDYFAKKHGHTLVPSSPCVPADDPTLMFTNAGMNQFKDVFLATGTRSYSRAVNSQKCIRAGGKHNDLDDVGHDTYHHTFFEMLGNWSFGDYFKAEAIAWAWDLLTNVWGLEKDRLYATYFEGDAAEGLEPDTEARDLWLKILPPQRVHPGKKKDNFWEMGDTGPCGPCSEIHIDLTPDKSGGPLVNAGDARVIEIWNLVFIQFNRGADRKLTPLPAKHVDTGMGFERITAIIQGVNGNYDTDLFTSIFAEISKVTGAPAYTGLLEEPPDQRRDTDQSQAIDQSRARKEAVGARSEGTPSGNHTNNKTNNDAIMRDVAYRVIADHLRCLVFAITDGAVPGNEGRGYVLRRILRRAVRYGRQYLDTHEPFLCKLIPTVVKTISGAFPELKQDPERIAEIIRDEEKSFGRTLDRGIALFEDCARASELVAAYSDMLATATSDVSSTGLEVKQLDSLYEEMRRIHRRHPNQQTWSNFGNLTAAVAILKTYVVELDQKRYEFELKRSRKESNSPSLRPREISGQHAFELHDTYGFPIDLTELMATERGLTVNIGEYERLMDQARDRSRVSYRAEATCFAVSDGFETDDSLKYARTRDEATLVAFGLTIMARTSADRAKNPELLAGDKGVLILDRTPFYAEQGGQVGDCGRIEGPDWSFEVQRTQREGNVVAHFGVLRTGRIAPPHDDYTVRASIDVAFRNRVMPNHTATHILNWALREVLGDHVQQKGSLVDPDKTRFDLSHSSSISHEELARIEDLVNEQIADNLAVYTGEKKEVDARKINTLRAVFGEKYPETVRIVSIGVPINDLMSNPDNPEWMQYSVEFCGGTHLQRTGEAGRFRLVEESAVAKGIRRVVGVTGERAAAVDLAAAELSREIDATREGLGQPLSDGRGSDRERGALSEPRPLESGQPSIEQAVSALNTALNTAELPLLEKNRLRGRLSELQEHVKTLKKQAAKTGTADILGRLDDLLAKAERLGDHAIIAVNMGQATIDQLRAASDALRSRAGSAAVFLASEFEGKAVLLAAMTKDITARGIKAGELMKSAAPIVGGRGGGRPDMAQGGGPDTDKIDEAVEHAAQWLRAAVAP